MLNLQRDLYPLHVLVCTLLIDRSLQAEEMVFTILDLYRRVYEELLAVPVIKGVKTEVHNMRMRT